MGHKILLADDSITIQKVIELTFSDEDFELHTVGNGQKAIDEISAIQPDIVLCDIIMPEKNGYEVCEFIKSTDALKHIPVLLLTGAFEPFDQERAKAAGCEGFLAKPFEPQTLISKVKELLANAQGGGAPAAAPVAAAPEPIAPAPIPMQPDPLMQESAFANHGDETVLVPPPAATPPPPVAGPQVPAMPTPAPFGESPGLDENFAVEAGERELAMDPGDHTMLLGANDSPDVPAPPAPPASLPGASDDIWNDVGGAAPTPPSPSVDEDDAGATVFMAGAPLAGVDPAVGGVVDNEMTVGNDPDATWQMPSDAEAAPPPPPGGDLGGFEEFAAPTPPPAEPAPPAPAPPAAEPPELDVAPPPLQQQPEPPAMEPPPMVDPLTPMAPMAPLEMVDPLTPEPPELGATNEVPPVEMTPEPIPSVDTQATIDPVLAGGSAPEPLTAEPEPLSPEPPELSEMPAMSTEPETNFTPVDAASGFSSMDTPEPPAPAAPEPPAPSPPATPAAPAPPPMAPPMDAAPMELGGNGPAAPSEPAAAAGHVGSVDDDLVERVAQRVVDKLSSKVIQEIAWEVVPDLAEGLIQREIDVLKSKLPKSG